jgi:hypothetical protein
MLVATVATAFVMAVIPATVTAALLFISYDEAARTSLNKNA